MANKSREFWSKLGLEAFFPPKKREIFKIEPRIRKKNSVLENRFENPNIVQKNGFRKKGESFLSTIKVVFRDFL